MRPWSSSNVMRQLPETDTLHSCRRSPESRWTRQPRGASARNAPKSSTHPPTGQRSTITSRMGKSSTLSVAMVALIPLAAAAIKQSAWCNVTPSSANSRRQLPAWMACATPRGAKRSPLNRRRAAPSSPCRRPRQISSTDIAQTHGSMPRRRKPDTRDAAGRPRSASIRTVESSNSRAMPQPDRRSSPRRCRRTHSAGSSSHS